MTKRCRLVFLANLVEGGLKCIDGLVPATFGSDKSAQVFSQGTLRRRLANSLRNICGFAALQHDAVAHRVKTHHLVRAPHMRHDGDATLGSCFQKRGAEALRTRGQAENIRISQESGEVGLIKLAKQGNVVKTLACNLLTLTTIARQCAYEPITKHRCRLRKRKSPLFGFETPDKGDECLVMRMQLVTKVPF